MNDKAQSVSPVKIVPFPNGEIGISWSDGKETYISAFALRCACPCAACVDEMTGKKVLKDSSIPKSVQAKAVHRVGNYAVGLEWSDGHDTGIYTFPILRDFSGPTAAD